MNNMMRSNYLNVALSLETYERINEKGKKVLIITHNSLEDVLFNQLPNVMQAKGMSFHYEVEKIHVSDTIASFMCKIVDSCGRIVFNTGESDKAFMQDNVISLKNYIRIAKNRAIDAALIRYLDLPTVDGRVGKIYSDAEDLNGISYEKSKSYGTDTSVSDFNTEASMTAPNVNSSHENKNQENFMQPISNIPTDWNQYIIDFGSNKKYSIVQIYENGKGGKDWLLKMVKLAETNQLNSRSAYEQYPMIKAFLQEKGDL